MSATPSRWHRVLKNLVFIGFVLVGLVALAATLFPPEKPEQDRSVRLNVVESDDFSKIVAEVDAAVEKEWAARGIQPAPEAPPLTVARRLSLALMGTVPSLEEIRKFEEYQKQDGRHPEQWWLAGMLDNPEDRRFCEYFGERLARAYVGTENGPFILFRRRRFVTWLADALNENRPYDRIVREMIASEGLWTDNPATNFVTISIEGGTDDNHPKPETLAGRVSRAFLGMRLDCANCHDHPFEDWKQADFRGLAAFFGQAKTTFTGIQDDRQVAFMVEDRYTGDELTIEPAVPFAKELLPTAGSKTRRQRLAEWVTHRENQYFARATVNRVWAYLIGRPLIEPVDDLTTRGQTSLPLELLAKDFAEHGFNLKRLIRVIAATRVFQLESRDLEEGVKGTWAAFPVTRLRPEQVVGGLLQSSSLQTIDHESHILVRLARYGGEQDFVNRYGDLGEDELLERGGTIPQRLLMMNGNIVQEKTKQDMGNAATRIAQMAPDNKTAVEVAYLAVLTRKPTAPEAEFFEAALEGKRDRQRVRELGDLVWALLNSTEFSWNH